MEIISRFVEKHCKSGKVRKSKWPELQFGGHYRPKYDSSAKEAAFRERPGATAVTNKTGKIFLLQAQNKGALMSCRLHCTTDRRCL